MVNISIVIGLSLISIFV